MNQINKYILKLTNFYRLDIFIPSFPQQITEVHYCFEKDDTSPTVRAGNFYKTESKGIRGLKRI